MKFLLHTWFRWVIMVLGAPCSRVYITLIFSSLQPGYHVKQVGQYSFSCQKLGQISVRLYSSEDSNEPFPSVLLSLSGEDGYRNNSVTGVGGTFMFDNLFPGSFYLRPLLKVLDLECYWLPVPGITFQIYYWLAALLLI